MRENLIFHLDIGNFQRFKGEGGGTHLSEFVVNRSYSVV